MKHIHNLVLILCITFLSVMGVSIVLPILPLLARQFDLTPTEVGLIIACFSLPSTFFTPIAGILADFYGRKKILLSGLFIFTAGGMGCAFSQSFNELLCFRVIQGLGAAPLGILYSTLIGDLYPENKRPKMMGIVGATISISAAIYPIIGGFSGGIHWTLPFWFSLLALPVAIIAIRAPYNDLNIKINIKDYVKISKKIIFKPHAIGLFSITFLCFSILYGPTLTYFPLLANLLYEASPEQIGMVFSIACLGTALVALNLSQLGKRYSHRNLLLMAATCYLTSQGCILFLPSQIHNLWLFALPIFVIGIGQGISFPLISSRLISLAPTSNRGIAMAINSTVMRLSQTISPLFFGLGWTLLGWEGPFIFGVITSILLMLLIFKTFIPYHT